jgi:hypothetical protein
MRPNPSWSYSAEKGFWLMRSHGWSSWAAGTAGESIDVNLPAVGSRSRTSEGLEIGREVVGIVRQGFQGFPFQDELAGIWPRGPY